MNLYPIYSAAARLPWGFLYALADIAAPMLRLAVRYRRKTVRRNLDMAYPELTVKERRRIERQFYRNLADDFVETLKLLHITDDEMRHRMEFRNTELIDRLMEEGRSIVVYFGHFFNWEWAPSVSLHTARKPSDKTVFAQIYRRLRDKKFDALMLRLRSRFHSESIEKSRSLRRLMTMKRDGTVSITGFMSDQHPSHGDPGYITTLMGIPTAIISGTESLARRLDMSVIYWDMEKTSRGHYRITSRLIAERPDELAEGEITAAYARMLETTIRRDPALWLWSHKRWKRPVKLPEQ